MVASHACTMAALLCSNPGARPALSAALARWMHLRIARCQTSGLRWGLAWRTTTGMAAPTPAEGT